jgi:hypothetical protein
MIRRTNKADWLQISMILKPFTYLTGMTLILGAGTWFRMSADTWFRRSDSADIDPFFLILSVGMIWLGGTIYILYAHFKYKTEYNFDRPKTERWGWKEWWRWEWRWEIIRWVVLLVVVFLFIAAHLIKQRFIY